MASRSISLLAGVALACLARPAAADDEAPVWASPTAAWAVTAAELSLAGTVAIAAATERWSPWLGVVPATIVPAVAYAAHRWSFDPGPAFALHGAGWMGLDLFLIGAMIDGHRVDRSGDRLHRGPTAWALGAAGAATGAVLGATLVEGDAAPWLLWPAAGCAIGGFFGVNISVARGGIRPAAIGAAAGLGLGLAAATWAHARRDAPDPASPRGSSRGPLLVQLGGRF